MTKAAAKPNTNAAPTGHLAADGPMLGWTPGRGLPAMQRANASRDPIAKKNRSNALAKPIKSPVDHLWGIK